MKLTKRGEYALKTLLILAGAYGQRTLSLGEIARSEKLPLKFLEQIMMTLRRNEFVESSKGKGGGYALSRSPKEVMLGEVIRAVEGPLAPIATAAEIEKRARRDVRYGGLYLALLEVRNAVAGILDRKSLADILEKSLELSWSEPSNQMYYI